MDMTTLNSRYSQVKVMARNTAWFIRYADDFIIGINNPEIVPIVMDGIRNFLAERGLELSEEKTRMIDWVFGSSFDYLSWTFR